MRAFVLPDEDTWVVPAFWRQEVHPRRGGCPGPARVVPPDATERLRDWLRSEKVAKSLRRMTSERDVIYDPVLQAEGWRYLSDWQSSDDPGAEASVLGAAVATLLTRCHVTDAEYLVDVWVSRFGIEFAVRVVGELAGIIAASSLWSVDPTAEKTYESLWRGEDLRSLYRVARALRSHLAVATDDDYERACEILGGYRTSPVGRITTSYLVPTQVGWVDDDCAAAAGWSTDRERGAESGWGDERSMSAILLHAASSVRHLELLRGTITSSLLGYRSLSDVGTVLDGVGPAAAPILLGPFYLQLLWLHDSNFSSSERFGPEGLRLLAEIPTDDAFRLMCRDTVGALRIRLAALLKSGMITRYPVRALRILAELEAAEPATFNDKYGRPGVTNPHESAVYKDLLGTQVLAEPRLVPAAAGVLPAPVLARAREIVASGGAGIGTGLVDLLDSHAKTPYYRLLESAEDEKRAIAALAAVPTDEALGHLVDRVERKYFRPALLTVAKRDPQRALRVLIAKTAKKQATEAPETLVELLRNHVLAYPEAVAEALPALDAPARARVEAILASVAGPTAQQQPGATPPVLAGPPRGPNGKPMRVPDLPEWLVLPTLPAISPRDGGPALPQDAARQLAALLAVSKIAAPHPGIAEVRAHCEPHSLAVFAWAVFEQWQAAEYPAKHQLAMVALALLGDDTTVPALTALFPSWAKGSSVRVRTGMDVLAAIGSDVALTHLHRLARKAETKGFRAQAEQRLGWVGEARGLSPEQLADQIVPDLGLDADGRTTVDYGPRQFTVGFDEQFAPRFTDQHGAPLARLPRPVATDDQELAPAAYRRFAELKKDVRSVAGERIRALEQAMVMGRRWTGAEFQRLLVRHPLVWQLVRRLLWATFDERGGVATLFRAAEDRTFADIDDKTLALDDAATVGLAHPWHFTADRPAWAEIFADYEIIQPFAQLSREVFSLATTDPGSFAGSSTEGRKLFMLTARGWRFSQGHDAVLRSWPENRTVEIGFAPGYHWQEPEQQAKQLARIRVWTTTLSPDGSAGSGQPHPEDPAKFADLDPIAASEVLRDLRFLTE
ncbi:DUF4132 domain-containing protein [Actinoplanes sp. ATCC 53533]|uniref:DUF4132 domain-containing protein n=1 Tax=Actinoplanes sp. ATCC 53533 TaxID=1288362 RepID=UPI000F791913|nr:DUF4132 domain-containing protein [Actinoplanes sp. ATCC 53533]